MSSIENEIDLNSTSSILSLEFDETITTNRLETDLTFFANTIYKIRSNIDNSYSNPYRISSLNNTLMTNMLQGSDSIKDYLFPVFNHLCEFNNSLYTYFIGNFFESVLSKKIVNISDLGKNIKVYGSTNLKKTLFLHFLKSKVNYSQLRELILDLTEDEKIIENYSDILAINYFKEPERIISLLNDITPKYSFFNIGKLEDKKEQAILKLTIFFFVKVLVDSKGKIENANVIKDLLFEKYKFVLESIYEHSINPVSIKVKEAVFKFLEDAGIQQWKKGIGNKETGREINNYFFVEYKNTTLTNKTQRSILEEYFKYFIELFNETLDSSKETEFIDDSIKMIEFGKFSINGYLSCIALHVYIMQLGLNRRKTIDTIVNKLTTDPNDSNHFFLSIFIDNLLKTRNQNPEFYLHVLSISKNIISPLIVKGELNFNPFYFLDNTFFADNPNEEIFSEITTEFFKIDSQEIIKEITPKITYISFLDNKKPSRYIAAKIFELNLFKNSLWKESLVIFLASCFDNDREFILNLLSKSKNSFSINEWQLVNKSNSAILSLHFPRSYQSEWNEFIVSGFIENRKIKYFLIKDLIGGLIQSNSVPDFSKEFRKFIIELTKSFYDESKIYNNSLSIDEVYKGTISKKEVSKAEYYTNE
ncbi:MAG: hypothetical protein WCK67_08385 [bacterium]